MKVLVIGRVGLLLFLFRGIVRRRGERPGEEIGIANGGDAIQYLHGKKFKVGVVRA